jgi:hypothetical protein
MGNEMQVEKCQQNLDAFYSLSSDGAEFLREVYEREAERCRDTLILVFKSKLLSFVVNEDDDTLSVSCKKITTFDKRGLRQKNRSSTWRRFIGESFGWGWVTVNQQGYCDGALLSFDGITPDVCLEVAASSIEISNVVLQGRTAAIRS